MRTLKFLLPFSIIVLTSTYLLNYSSWAQHRDTTDSQKPFENDADNVNQDIAQKKYVFIEEASNWDIDGPFNNTALHNLCAGKSWREGLHFKCAPAFGGVGNVRNIVLTCVRYAIEAGG
jgi:hypothetical protein